MSVRMERGCGNLSGRGTPVADNFAVQKDDRPEDAPVVMGLVAMVRVKDYLAAFVADQVFVVGRKRCTQPLRKPRVRESQCEMKSKPFQRS